MFKDFIFRETRKKWFIREEAFGENEYGAWNKKIGCNKQCSAQESAMFHCYVCEQRECDEQGSSPVQA